jgi:hypothetical protein
LKLTGQHANVPRELVRAWLHASAAVLAYHGHAIDLATLRVKVVELEGDEGGIAYPQENRFELDSTISREEAATVVLHELIHLGCGDFCPDDASRDTDEKCTSTLTAKLKPGVAAIAQLLIDGTYKRAAYFAHTKIAYRNDPGRADYYDSDQDTPVGVTDKHMSRRTK